MSDLGRLKKVELRNIWKTEASDFTPWLAQEENLAVLSETLGFDLELEAQEKSVGRFRADLLCKDIGRDSWVLIENQLERTDHTHLGQILTYAAGLDAVTIVWIAARFTEEHRATLDWLNKITDESFRFFGLEVELWCIGESSAAPKFNIISKPNNWSKSVAKAAREIDASELSETRLMQVQYWDGLHEKLNAAKGSISGNRKAQPQSWMNYSIGRSKFSVGSALNQFKNRLSAEIYITGADAKAFFHLLHAQREDIEAELGFELTWDVLPEGQDTRIALYKYNVDPNDKSDWDKQHIWFTSKLNALHKAFAARIRSLDARDWSYENLV